MVEKSWNQVSLFLAGFNNLEPQCAAVRVIAAGNEYWTEYYSLSRGLYHGLPSLADLVWVFLARPCTYCDAQFSWLLWYTAAQGRRKNLHFLLQSVFFDWCTYIRHNYIHNQCFSQVSKNVLRLWSLQLDISLLSITF